MYGRKRILVAILNQTSTLKDQNEAKLTLKPVRLELLAPKMQFLLAAIAGLLVCLVSYGDALKVGFLLDDFLHLDYLSRAIGGDWGDFLHNFYGNWANSPLMQSFRPLVSLDLFLDYLAFGYNAWGFHLINILLLWACSVPLGLICMELSGLRGNRLGAAAAIWSILLFAVYPLHLEATAWIIGRVDLLCTFFYLLSIFAYLRFRLLREKFYFYLALLSFIGAFFSKEMAVTLPAVITAAELLLYPLFQENNSPEFAAKRKTWRMACLLSFWAVFGILFGIRTIALGGTVVGGYGTGGHLNPGDILAKFGERSSIDRILFPVNLDILSRSGQWDLKEMLVKVSKGAYALILSSALLRVFLQAINWRIMAFLLVWMLAALAPTFQIWQISPNLVGSRLFFLSSAPFVILLSFLALPAIDAVKPTIAKILSALGAIGLFILVCVWSYWLQVDLKAWTGAAACLQTFKTEALQHLSSTDGKILFLNLPGDYSGAGMLSRGDYLKFLLSQSKEGKDAIEKRVMVLEPGANQAHFDYSLALAAALKDRSIKRVLQWKAATGINDTGSLSVWSAPDPTPVDAPEREIEATGFKLQSLSDQEEENYLQVPASKLEQLTATEKDEWTVEEDGRSIRKSDNGIVIKPGKHGINLIFNVGASSTLNATAAQIKGKSVSGQVPALTFLWSASHAKSANAKIEFQQTPFQLGSAEQNKTIIALGENKDWALTGLVNWVGIHLPKGDYEIELSQIELLKRRTDQDP